MGSSRQSLVAKLLWNRKLRLCAIVLGVFFASQSETHARQATVLCVTENVNVQSWPLINCVDRNGDIAGQMYMTSTQTATIAVRQLLGLRCAAFGYDASGDVIGNMSVTTEEGIADKCFIGADEDCFTFSPVRAVRLSCETFR